MIAELLTAPLAPLDEKLRAKPAGGADDALHEGDRDRKRTLAAAQLAFLRRLGGKEALTPDDEKDMKAAGAVYEIVGRGPEGEQLSYECKKREPVAADVVQVPVPNAAVPSTTVPGATVAGAAAGPSACLGRNRQQRGERSSAARRRTFRGAQRAWERAVRQTRGCRGSFLKKSPKSPADIIAAVDRLRSSDLITQCGGFVTVLGVYFLKIVEPCVKRKCMSFLRIL
jgi:hypothetical protein